MSSIVSVIEKQLGPLVILTPVCSLLLGIFFTQAVSYLSKTKFKTERLTYSIVAALLVLNIVKVAFHIYGLYFRTTLCWGQINCLIQVKIDIPGSIFLIGFSLAIVQVFYANRVAALYDKSYLKYGFYVLTVGLLVTTIIATIQSARLKSLLEVGKMETVLTTQFGIILASNSLTCLALCLKLYLSRTGYSRTDFVVAEALRWLMTSGALFTAVAITLSVLYKTLPKDNNWNELPYTVLPLVEDICVMLVISGRERAREHLRKSANGASESNPSGNHGMTSKQTLELQKRASKVKSLLADSNNMSKIQVRKETTSQGYESMV